MTTKRDGVFINQLFAHLRVVGEPFKVGKSYRVACECVCGETILTDLYHLVSGRTHSCGCNGRGRNYPKEVSELERQLFSDYYLCQCRCGTMIEVNAYCLVAGHVRSCGCQ